MKKNQFILLREATENWAYLDPIQERWSDKVRPIIDEFTLIKKTVYKDYQKKRKPIDEKYSKLAELIYL